MHRRYIERSRVGQPSKVLSLKTDVSIIIPVYNDANCIAKCLKSVTGWEEVNAQIIVVEGQSHDHTMDEITPFVTEINHLISEKDNGVYDAMNKGLDHIKSDWVYFLGADDTVLSESAMKSLIVMNGDEKIRIGKVKIITHDSRVPNEYPAAFGPCLVWRNCTHHQGALYHHSLFQTRKFDTSFKILADYKMNLELWLKGQKALLSEVELAECGDGGLSRDFSDALYSEELRLKNELLSGWKSWIQPIWVALKKRYKS